MRFVIVMLALVVVSSVSSGCLLNRPNPRLKKLTTESGSVELETSFKYDDAGHPVKVAKDFEGGETEIELEWEGNLLVKVTVDAEGDDDEEETEIEYEGDRAVKYTVEKGSRKTTGELEYDDAGRIAKQSQTTKIDGDKVSELTNEFEWDDDGNLEALDSEQQRFDPTGEDDPAPSTNLTLEYSRDDDGRIGEIEADGSFEFDGEVAYDDQGRVEKIEVDGDGTGADGEYVYEYDEDTGLVVTHTFEADEGEDTETELEYDDGEASGVDMAPTAVSFFGMFDLKGKAHPGPQTNIYVPRLMNAEW